MNNQFTDTLRTWLDTPEAMKDYAAGNMLLLQLSGNKIRYNNFARNLDHNKIHINYQLEKYYNFRVENLTKEEVKAMTKKADKIVEAAEKEVKKQESTAKKNALPELVKGMRTDHAELPEDIQALYERNRIVIRQIQECHLQLRKLSLTETPCPDSDRYPFLKELIKLDKEYHDNWAKYDNYTPA